MNLENTQDLKDSFRIGYSEFEGSYIEAEEVHNMYHNRQWTADQLAVLGNRGQPKETFNVIKLFARMLVGYYSTVVNTAVALPTQESDVTIASLATDIIKSVFERNHFTTEGDKIKLSAILSGLMCCYVAPENTGRKDRFGRPIYNIVVEHVPEEELVLDPMSRKEDYSDARWLHRWKWMTGAAVDELFGRGTCKKLEQYYNYLGIPQADYTYTHPDQSIGYGKAFDNYLITHSVVKDDKGRRWSVYWCGDHILEKTEITYKNVTWSYRVVKVHTSSIPEFYGIFREVVETQKAINQAIVKLQLMVNSQKVFVETNAVKNIDEFTNAVNRVTGVIPVTKMSGIKVENLSAEAVEQYVIIDRALDRIQRILNINDSFLGMAYASDSGRKVKLQQDATILALRYLTERIQLMYRLLGEDILGLASQYMYAEQTLRVTDEITGYRFVQLNKPVMEWTGQMDEQGQPIMQPIFEQVMDPETGKPLVDDEGNYVYAPVPEEGTELVFDELDLTVETSSYAGEDERNQLLLETIINGSTGQLLSQINPAGFFKIAGMSIKSMKTRYSPEISAIFEQTAEMLSQDPAKEEGAAVLASQQQSKVGQGSQLPVPNLSNSGGA